MNNALDPSAPTRSCSILGVGAYTPERKLTNSDLEALVETSDEWIVTRTGIRERRIAAEDEFTSTMGSIAINRAAAQAGIAVADLDLIIVATITPDMLFPSTACLIQTQLGADRAAAFDIEAACSGFVYALEIGAKFVQSGTAKYVAIVGAEKLSAIIDWRDRNTCVLFGDGAGAAILGHHPDRRGVLATHLGSDGSKANLLSMPGGGCQRPATHESLDQRLHFLRMDGKETFKNAVTAMARAAESVLEKTGLQVDDIDLIIPHQANQRILNAVRERLAAPEAKLYSNVARYGNTSAASVGIALAEAFQEGRLTPGCRVLLLVFGAGLTWGASIIEW